MKKKCWIVLCVVFMLSVAAGCGSKSMETMSDFASGESSMNAAIENEDYKNLAEAQKIADVEDVTAISERLIKQNMEAYKELTK